MPTLMRITREGPERERERERERKNKGDQFRWTKNMKILGQAQASIH